MDFNPARKELTRAQRCIERMKAAKTYDEYDEAWTDYLSRIENIFTKIKLASEKDTKYPSFSSKVNHQRSTDELLVYLKQARNTEHHGIADTSRFKPGGFSIDPITPGGVVHIGHMIAGPSGISRLELGTPAKVAIHPSSIEVIPCINRSRVYNPPEIHLGTPVNSKSPIIIAELGYTFYQEFLSLAEKTFTRK